MYEKTLRLAHGRKTSFWARYDQLIHKLETGLAQRYLRSSDFPDDGASQNRIYIDGTAVNGRISQRRTRDQRLSWMVTSIVGRSLAVS